MSLYDVLDEDPLPPPEKPKASKVLVGSLGFGIALVLCCILTVWAEGGHVIIPEENAKTAEEWRRGCVQGWLNAGKRADHALEECRRGAEALYGVPVEVSKPYHSSVPQIGWILIGFLGAGTVSWARETWER